MSDLVSKTEGRVTLWHDRSALDPLEPGLFDPHWLAQNNCLRGSATGRSQAYFLSYGGLEMVLRHFRRGGLIGRINPDRYLRGAPENGRAAREFRLLAWMRDQGLPVPRPIAARQVTGALWYRADLLTERIPGAQPLAELLRSGPLDGETWQRIGSVIGAMHRNGVHHSDLNGRNILLDPAGAVWLIDFDKCERRAPGHWAAENLARLHRSLAKEQRLFPGLHWTESDWQVLRERYAAAGA